jgi:probable HAF family extracellular repeat protein
MSSRPNVSLLTAAGSLLIALSFVLLFPLAGSAAPAAPPPHFAATSPLALGATAGVTGVVSVTPSAVSLVAGEMLTITAKLTVTGTCNPGSRYYVELSHSPPVFTDIDFSSFITGPPDGYSATWRLIAHSVGSTTFTVRFSVTESFPCDGALQFVGFSGQSPPITVTGSYLRLPFAANTPPTLYPLRGVDLGTLGGKYSSANDVNTRGQVVGSSTVVEDERAGSHAFLWQNGGMQDLGVLGGRYSYVDAINERGQIAGSSSFDESDEPRAFFWENGRMVDIGTLDAPWNQASYTVDINAQGQVAGVSRTSTGEHRCFVWAAGVITDLGTLGGETCTATDINDRGQIVGQSQTGVYDNQDHAFVWEDGVMIDLTPTLPPNKGSTATVINERGQVGGHVWSTSGGCESSAFLWENGVLADLYASGQGLNEVEAINEQGQVVGYGNCQLVSFPYGFHWEAMLWDTSAFTDLGFTRQTGDSSIDSPLLNNRGQIVMDSGGRYSTLWLDGIAMPLAAPDGDYTWAYAMDDAGHVVGRGSTVEGGHAMLWNIPALDGE